MDANFVPTIKCHAFGIAEMEPKSAFPGVLIGDYDVGKRISKGLTTHDSNHVRPPKVNDTIQVHVEHVYRLYLLNIHDTEGVHPPSPQLSPTASPDLEEPDEIRLNLSDKSHSNSSQHGSEEAKVTSRRLEYGLADVILVCFSLANRTSFENVETVWCNELRQLCPHVPFVVIGCKLDLRRPDPTTPALVRSPRQTQSSKFPFRRPKFTRSSTASTLGSETPASPGSDNGHHRGESSSTQPSNTSAQHLQQAPVKVSSHPPMKPVGILTNSTPPGSYPGNTDPSQAPSDTEGSAKKLRSKSSFNVPFPRSKTFRRKSTLDVPTLPSSTGGSSSATPTTTTGAAPHSSSSSKAPQRMNTSAAQSHKESDPTITVGVTTTTPTLTIGPTITHSAHSARTAGPTSSPTRTRHVNLPPLMRSISHATVFRRVLNRSRSGTGAHSGGVTGQSHDATGIDNESGQGGQDGKIGSRDKVPISPKSRKSSAIVSPPDSVPTGGASGTKPPESASAATGAVIGPGASNLSATGRGVARAHDERAGDGSAEPGFKRQEISTAPTSIIGGAGLSNETPVDGSRAEAVAERPALVQRFTSGSADEGSSVMKIHSHIRTNSQPQPSPFTLPLSSPSLAAAAATTPPLAHALTTPTGPSYVDGSLSPNELLLASVRAGGVGRDGDMPVSSNAKGKGKVFTIEPASSNSNTSRHDASSTDNLSQILQAVPPVEVSPTRRQTRIEEPNVPPRSRPHTTSYQEARSVARNLGACGYIECSALTLVNVVDVFDLAVRVAVERRNASASSLHRHSRRNDDCVVN